MAETADLIDNPPVRGPAQLGSFPQKAQDEDKGSMPISTSGKDEPLVLLNHPALLYQVPALKDAFDSSAMRDRLQESLFGDSSLTGRIESCTPGKAFYDSSDFCIMQYVLKVRQGDQRISLVINAVLFPDLASCTRYYQESIIPLVKAAGSRPEYGSLQKTAAIISDLSMVVSVFPIDGQLPTLVGATDLELMTPMLGSIYSEATHEQFTVKTSRIELAHYGRFKRCVLRYWLTGQTQQTGEIQSRLMYGKVDEAGSNQQTLEVTDAIMSLGQANTPSFKIPRIYATLPELKLVLMEAVPGEAAFSRLLKTRVRGAGTPQLDDPLLEDAIIGAARVAAALHSSSILFGPQRTFNDDISSLREAINGIQHVLPEIGDPLLGWLLEIANLSETQPTLPLLFSHGDFTYTQFIYHQGEIGLVDFDNICQAEPALDLGQFLAYLRFNIRKEELPDQPFPPEAVDQLCSIFLSTYLERSHAWLRDETNLITRITAYEMISYIRLGVHSWQKLKGRRLQHAIALLEERMPCLTQRK